MYNMGWDEVKKLHNRFTKYPLDLLYYIADYKMHGKKSYAYNVRKIRNMIYDNVDISMFDDDLMVDTFMYNLVERSTLGKAIAARCDVQDKGTYKNVTQLREIFRTPLVTNPPVWFKKILMDEYFIRLGILSGFGYETSYILAKCHIPADYIFKVMNKDSIHIVSGMTNTFDFHRNEFSTRDWDGRIFDLDRPGLNIKNNGYIDPFELAQEISITSPSIIGIKGFYIDPSVSGYYLNIITPESQYNIFNLTDILSIRDTIEVTDILRKKIDSFNGINGIYGREGYIVSCNLYIIGDTGTSLIGGPGIKLIGRLYTHRNV